MIRPEENLRRRVIGVDPGPVPGVVVLDCTETGIARVEALQCTPGLLQRVLTQFEDTTHALAVEQFVTRGRATHDQRLTRDQVAQLQEWFPEAVLRPAVTVKPWATDARLAKAGLLEPTKAMRHARDAARQALFAAVHDAGLPDPLSKRWEASR